MDTIFYYGCVENRLDPMKLGRCQVRIVGLHTDDKQMLPTDDLPWAYPLMPSNSTSMSGLGWSPTGIVQGTWVICIFMDIDKQQPIILGTIGGIPHTKTASLINDATNSLVTTDETGDLVTGAGDSVSSIMEDILSPPNAGTVQQEGLKYVVIAVSTNGSTVYNVMGKDTTVKVATGTYNETTQVYEVTLVKPEQYSQEQYLPFTDINPKTFNTTDEIAQYFDTYF